MKFEPGFVVVGIAMLIFYLRLAQLRGRHRRQAAAEAAERARQPKKSKNAAENLDQTDKNQPSYGITSWVLVVIAIVLMLVGLAAKTSNWLPVDYQSYWWIAVSAGVLLFTFCFK